MQCKFLHQGSTDKGQVSLAPFPVTTVLLDDLLAKFTLKYTGWFFLTGPPLNCLSTNFFTISGT